MKLTISLLSIFSIILFTGGCGGGGSTNEILVGEFSSLTGTTATFGLSTHRGLLLAVDEVNTAGGC